MKRVTGIGGVFITAKDPELGVWYKTHLGIDVQDWGRAAFRWADRSPRLLPSPRKTPLIPCGPAR